MADNPVIFNRQRVRQHRDRAAATFSQHDFLLREMAARLADRLPDIKRRFPQALDLGAHNGVLAEYVRGLGGIEMLVSCDLSAAMIGQAAGLRVAADEEWLPFAPASFDIVMSVNSLHWVNDLPGTLIQIHRVLKPGGLLLAMLPGGQTLKELRESFEQAELSLRGGMSPRLSPFIDVKDAGSLLQRAGFQQPVTDSETLTISYEAPIKLLQDIKGMGETSALAASPKGGLRRNVLFAALAYYQQHFGDAQQRIPASIELVTLTGWKADAAA